MLSSTSTSATASPQQSRATDSNFPSFNPTTSSSLTLTSPHPIAPSLSPASLSFLLRPMQTWTADQAWTWLHHLNLGQYDLFHHRSIDGDMLLDVTDDDLRTELGVDDKFHRGKILKRIKEHTDRQQHNLAASAAAPHTAQPSAGGMAGSRVDEYKHKRERKPGKFQLHRPRASSYHTKPTVRSPSPHTAPRQPQQRPSVPSTSSLQPREHYSVDGTSSDRYDHCVMLYELMAALQGDGDRWDGMTDILHHTDNVPSRGAAVIRGCLSSALVLRRADDDREEGAERIADEAGTVWRSARAARVDNLDSPVFDSSWDDEAEEKERREQLREQHRRWLQLPVSHNQRHRTLSAPHAQGNMCRSHSVDFSTDWSLLQTYSASVASPITRTWSSTYRPAQETLTASMSADSLSSAHCATQSHRSLLPLPSHHSSQLPQAAQAPAMSPPPYSHKPSYQPHSPANLPSHLDGHSASHPHHCLPQPLPSAAPSHIDRLSSVFRSSPTYIDEVTNLTILSSGAAGHAYSGSFHSLPVVVKLPKTLEISDREWCDWRRELHCHTRLPPHPNLVRFVGALVMEDNNYIVTELVRQGSLKGVLATGAATGLPAVYSSGYAVLRAALDIGRGLSHMHHHRLVHRDISSRNILVDGDGTFIIADLGLCREMNKQDSAAAVESSAAGGVGSTGGFSGSDQYEMSRSTAIPVRWTSPEALLTSGYTSNSDVWALGVTLWEMATGGALPYQWVEGNGRLIQQVVDGTAQLSVDSHWEQTTDIGRRARNIIQLCLSRKVDDRPNSNQLVELLEAELKQWEREAAEEAQQHRHLWRAHHEQLTTRWEMNA